jgi:hypothetical protein
MVRGLSMPSISVITMPSHWCLLIFSPSPDPDESLYTNVFSGRKCTIQWRTPWSSPLSHPPQKTATIMSKRLLFEIIIILNGIIFYVSAYLRTVVVPIHNFEQSNASGNGLSECVGLCKVLMSTIIQNNGKQTFKRSSCITDLCFGNYNVNFLLISFSMSLKKGKMVIVKEEYTKTLDVLCLRHPNRWYNSRCYVFRLQFFIYNAYLELLGCCQNGPISAFWVQQSDHPPVRSWCLRLIMLTCSQNSNGQTYSLFDRNTTSEIFATFFAGRTRRFAFVDAEFLTPSENWWLKKALHISRTSASRRESSVASL